MKILGNPMSSSHNEQPLVYTNVSPRILRVSISNNPERMMENKMGHNVFSASTTVSKVTSSHLRRDVKKSASYIENVILFVHKRQFAE
jgi:hypothetical protein